MQGHRYEAIPKYSLFILEVVKAHVAVRPKYPQTIHYRGDGVFMNLRGEHGQVSQAVQEAKSLIRKIKFTMASSQIF